MKLMKCLMVISICLLCLGCAKPPIVWTKLNYSQQELQKDKYECNRDTKMAHPPADFGGGLAGALWAADYQKEGERFYRQCMESKGWKKE